VISATGIEQCLYDHGTENPRKPTEIPHEVKIFAIVRGFRRNGNRNPANSRSRTAELNWLYEGSAGSRKLSTKVNHFGIVENLFSTCSTRDLL